VIDCRFVPVQEWPGEKTKSYQRKRSPFDSTYSKTLDLLERELRVLNAKEILVQAYFAREHIRNDGWPKSNARPVEPGVILTFESKGKTTSIPCDKFTDWESNLRAIALALEALRKVDRYGVTRNGEQYRGWQQLPPAEEPAKPLSVREAATVIGIESGEQLEIILQYAQRYERAVPMAIKAAHPDKGGTTSRIRRVLAARAVLNQFHGVQA
jgi:hypothetical protein